MQERPKQVTLLYAASRGYVDEAKKLINRQSVAERDELGNTPLRTFTNKIYFIFVAQEY